MIKSFKDLNFLVPEEWKPGNKLPYKFLVYFNSHKEAEAACEYFWNKHGMQLKDNMVWFNSIMTEGWRSGKMKNFKDGHNVCEIMCTDTAGMVCIVEFACYFVGLKYDVESRHPGYHPYYSVVSPR